MAMAAPHVLPLATLALLALASSGRAEGATDADPGKSAYAAGRFVEALRAWRPLAERGDPRAAFGLGLLYDLGEGVEQDAVAALTWYRRAAEAGFVPAEFNLAVMHDSGVGTQRNPTQAALWYASAAAHGYARAEYNLAQLYEAGEGVPCNHDMAEAWYAAAASHGLSAAASRLEALRASRRSRIEPPAEARRLVPAVPTGPPVTPVPAAGESIAAELSFVAPAQPLPVDYFVQVLELDSAGPRPAFSTYSKRSAVLARLQRGPARYAWRVYTVAPSVSDYAGSSWAYFSVR